MPLLTLRSLWENASADVIIAGEGVIADAQIGTGEVLISTGTVGGIRKRRRKPRSRQRVSPYWVPVPQPVVPVVNVRVMGQGVAARPAIGLGTFKIGVDLHPDEILALLFFAADETPVRRKMRILARAVAGSYSREAWTI